MQHIKHCLAENKVLKRLQDKLADNGDKKAIRSLLSSEQRKEVIAITKVKNGYIVTLKSAYALYGIKNALLNFHGKVKIVIGNQTKKLD